MGIISSSERPNLSVIYNSNTATPLIYGEFDNNNLIVNGNFEFTGAQKASYDTTSVNKTLTVNDAHIIYCDASSNTITITLPDITSSIDKLVFNIKADDLTNAITINADASDTIEGNASYSFISENDVISIQAVIIDNDWKICY